MNTDINNLFIKAIGNKAIGYKAYFDIGNGKVGITAEYSLKLLKNDVIPECEAQGHKLIRIVKQTT